MKRLGHIVAVLAFVFALSMGAAGGAMVRIGPMDHHGSHHSPADSSPAHGGSHKAALVVLSPCCPAAEAPAKHPLAVTVTAVEVSWPSWPDCVSGARDIQPEPHPPKTSL